jgi:hypothetical protein
LARLIRALDDPRHFFFVHVDRKVALRPFQAAVGEHRNVVLVPDRVDVEWAKLSVVQATLNTIRAATRSGRTFERYSLLSGSDYPIKHKSVIRGRLTDSDREFLRIDRTLTLAPGDSHRRVLKDLPEGRYFADFSPFHGSMFWSLSAACIRFVLEFVDANPAYLDIHRHVIAPDEVFFHSLVKRSPFAGAISQDFSDGVHPDQVHHANHFIDWPTFNRRKLLLESGDFDALLASDALFARKFDERRSRKLLERLDKEIHYRS